MKQIASAQANYYSLLSISDKINRVREAKIHAFKKMLDFLALNSVMFHP